MPNMDHNPFAHSLEDMEEHMGLPGLGKLGQEDEEEKLSPQEAAMRKAKMAKAKAKLERIKDMPTLERTAFLAGERKRQGLAEDADLIELLGEDFDPLGTKARKKAWKSKSGDFGPPVPMESRKTKRRDAMNALTKDERHMHIREHQSTMQQHRILPALIVCQTLL